MSPSPGAGSEDESRCLVGILVGGKGTRFGGVAKGDLLRNGEPLLIRLLRIVGEATQLWGTAPRIALVGNSDAYDVEGCLRVADEPSGVGPLGGVRGLLRRAGDEHCATVLVLAVDLPYLESGLVGRLLGHALGPSVVAPRMEGVWQPLCARYEVAQVLPRVDAALARGHHSLRRVIEELGSAVAEVPLRAGDERQLRDWDSPADMEPVDTNR